MSYISKSVWFGLGFTFLIISILGLILPIVPSVPFLYLASACFYRSSKYFYKQINLIILNNEKLKNFIFNKKIGLYKIKIALVSVLWILIVIYIINLNNIYYSISLIISGLATTIIIMSFIKNDTNYHIHYKNK